MGVTTFLFAGGGTGGHLFPGLAIAEQLSEKCRQRPARSVFACSTRPLDAEILREQSVEFHPIPAAPFAVSPGGLWRFARAWGRSVREGRGLIRRLRGEGAVRGEVRVVAMGGFVAGPVVRAAEKEGAPVTLVNLDAVPGRANRWVARHACAVFTSAPVGESGWALVPPIVRRQAMPPGPPGLCRERLSLDPGRPTLLVTGASQGARSINDFLLEMVEHRPEIFRAHGWQVIHQTGKGELERVRRAYAAAEVPALVDQFIADMGAAWGSADLAVSRAGAGSVAEAWASGVPTVFMPYPYHKDQHQRMNARVLEERGACVVATDQIDAAANARGAGTELSDLMTHASRREAVRTALRAMGPADGAARVAQALLGACAPG